MKKNKKETKNKKNVKGVEPNSVEQDTNSVENMEFTTPEALTQTISIMEDLLGLLCILQEQYMEDNKELTDICGDLSSDIIVHSERLEGYIDETKLN